ncbi:MAG: hypothetical protein H8D26_04670 [Methanomicrobia archaeon]|nr:hypothetical protein [Methanomicrobia archaeon]
MKKRCGKCGKIKDSSEFYIKKGSTDGLQGWCKLCLTGNKKEWRKSARNRRSERKNEKRHKRTHVTRTSNKKAIYGKKRKRPVNGICELCNRECDKEKKILHYHHWDDDNIEKGVWVCVICHILIEDAERNEALLRKWHSLKAKIEEEVKENHQTSFKNKHK